MNTMVTIECSEGDVRNLLVPSGAILRENGRTSIFFMMLPVTLFAVVM